MNDHRHYLPILKGKAGEYEALEHFSPGVKPLLTPVIEVPPIESRYGDQLGVPVGRKTTVDDHVAGVAERIRASWGTEGPVFIDLLYADEYGNLVTGEHPLAHVFHQGRRLGLQSIPVTGIGRSYKYQNAVIEVVQRDARGVCIREEREECRCPTSLVAGVQTLVMTLHVARNEVDLILDVGAISDADVAELRMTVSSVISELPDVNDWRTIAVAATAMPTTVTLGMDRLSIKRIPRAERALWAAIANTPHLPRIPDFADYGVTHPDYADRDWREVSLGGKIRYTADHTWVIVKGCRLEGASEQFHELARMLVAEPEFCSRDFSWGDERIADCAALDGGPGSLKDWVAFTTNHHLRFVTAQLANGP